MATQVQLRRGTATENNSFTGAQGELTYDTTNKRVRVHDGGTAGGFEVVTEDASGNIATGTVTADALDVNGNGTIDGTLTITTADNDPQLIVTSTDADAGSGPEIKILRNSASPADNDALGQIKFNGTNDAAEEVGYAEIDAFLRDATDGTEDGEIRLNVIRNGAAREALSLGEDVVFNEGGEDVDVRIESSGNTHMFFLDGGNNTLGLGTDTATNPLTVLGTGGTGTTAAIRWRDENDQGATLGVYNSGNVGFNAEQGDLYFLFGGTGKFEMQSGGDLQITDGNLVIGTSGHGIDFSATANSSGTSDSELLDDYEQGTWTPTGDTNSGTAATFGSAEGSYVKIGNLVTINGEVRDVDTTGTTSTSQFRVAGLPFAPVSKNWTGVVSVNDVALQASRTAATSQVIHAGDAVSFIAEGYSTSRTNIDHGDITSGTSDFFFTIQYQTFS